MQLETLLRERGVMFEEDRHAATYTAQGLAHEEHVSGHMVAKPVIVKGATGFTMCVLPAPKRLVMHAGTHTWSISMSRQDWERVCEPVVAPISLS